MIFEIKKNKKTLVSLGITMFLLVVISIELFRIVKDYYLFLILAVCMEYG